MYVWAARAFVERYGLAGDPVMVSGGTTGTHPRPGHGSPIDLSVAPRREPIGHVSVA